MQFGQQLREERERRGISLDDVSVATRVSLRHLNALEADRYSELPGGIFNKGIVRSYAKACGMEPEETAQIFQEAMRANGYEPQQKEDDWVALAEAVGRNRPSSRVSNRTRWLAVLGMVVAVMLLAAGVLWVLVHRGVVHLPEKRHLLAVTHPGDTA